MPKRARGLSALKVQNAKDGTYVDGDGLQLLVKASGAASWILRYQRKGVRRDIGLGPARGLRALSLAEARQAAAAFYRAERAGEDVFAGRRQAKQDAPDGVTFQTVAGEYVATHQAAWRNPKHRAQWESTLATHAYPVIGQRLIALINPDDILTVLEPIWSKTPETASRLRGRLEAVMAAAIARGLHPGPNPAAWKGVLQPRLPAPGKLKRAKGSRHQPALPWRRMPDFWATLSAIPGTAARALQFAILTAARSGEVRGATWAEIDLTAGLWIVPQERMKAGRMHRVPLPPAAVALLRATGPGDGLVFPGRSGGELSDMALTVLLRRMEPAWLSQTGDQITAHGFRSTFRDWCNESAAVPAEIAEAALAHALRDKVQAAYSRSDHLDRRRQVMADWADFIATVNTTLTRQ